MVLDTLAYFPTILAYVFLGLLICILSFIVIYIGHKIYLIMYDNISIGVKRTYDYENEFMKDNPPPAVAITISNVNGYMHVQTLQPKGYLGPRLRRYTQSLDDLLFD